MAKSFQDMANEARSRITEVDVAQAAEAIRAGSVIVIDVREPDEYRQGHLEGALSIPRGVAEMGVPHAVSDRSARIICYCGVGNRSALAADSLKQMGYDNVESLIGGIQAWVRSGGQVVR